MSLQFEIIFYFLIVMFHVNCSKQQTKNEKSKNKQPVINEQLIFEQPYVGTGDIEDRIFVKENRPLEKWFMISWQESPYIEGGKPFMPVDWDPVEKTGFSIPGDRALNQRGYRNEAGSTACQMFGNTVGAYLNSADLSMDGVDEDGNPLPGSGGYKQGFFPSYHFSPQRLSGNDDPIYLWREEKSILEISLELQIPTAVCAEQKGSLAFVNPLLLLVDPKTNLKISWGPMLFSKRSNGDFTKPLQNIALDIPSNSWMVRDRLVTGASFLEVAPGSAQFQNSPWRGFKRFHWTVTREHVGKALKAMKKQEPHLQMSLDPGDYYLVHFHLNAETHYQTGPAELGWSMRNLRIVQKYPESDH
jgi:hypothetical protein